MDDAAGWTLAPGMSGLRFGGLAVSFQRFLRPASGRVETVPSSLGSLPVARASSHFLLPLARDEAFWIGMSSLEGKAYAVALQAVLPGGRIADLVEPQRRIPPHLHVAGLPRGDGSFSALSRIGADGLAGIGQVRISARSDDDGTARMRTAVIELVGYGAFSRAKGGPPPSRLDPDAGYKGYLLP